MREALNRLLLGLGRRCEVSVAPKPLEVYFHLHLLIGSLLSLSSRRFAKYTCPSSVLLFPPRALAMHNESKSMASYRAIVSFLAR
jgi:hypothetical protein